jgi:hypothetical protein
MKTTPPVASGKFSRETNTDAPGRHRSGSVVFRWRSGVSAGWLFAAVIFSASAFCPAGANTPAGMPDAWWKTFQKTFAPQVPAFCADS